jgi:hybrid cluster-associated redox disulfide protein
MQKIDKNMIIGEILGIDQGLAPILLEAGMHCLGCPSSQMESLEETCMVHGINVDDLLDRFNANLSSSAQ